MASGVTKRMFLSCAVLTGAITAGCEFSSNITLKNRTMKTLTPYPVKSTPPPPHREADPTNNILQGHTAAIDPHGFNPVYYASGVTDPNDANGVYIGLDLDDDPMMIQYKVFHYKVPPGEAGTDPAKQPILLKQGVKEVADVDLRITVAALLPNPGDWAVGISPE